MRQKADRHSGRRGSVRASSGLRLARRLALPGNTRPSLRADALTLHVCGRSCRGANGLAPRYEAAANRIPSFARRPPARIHELTPIALSDGCRGPEMRRTDGRGRSADHRPTPRARRSGRGLPRTGGPVGKRRRRLRHPGSCGSLRRAIAFLSCRCRSRADTAVTDTGLVTVESKSPTRGGIAPHVPRRRCIESQPLLS
jgi:hypothetical protein